MVKLSHTCNKPKKTPINISSHWWMERFTLFIHIQDTVRDYNGTAQHLLSFSCAAGNRGWSNQGLYHQDLRQSFLETLTPLMGRPMSLAGLTRPSSIISAWAPFIVKSVWAPVKQTSAGAPKTTQDFHTRHCEWQLSCFLFIKLKLISVALFIFECLNLK